MTDRIDDAMLLAYADGELDPETCRQMERQIARDPDTAERVAGFRQDASMLKAAFQHVLYQSPAPEAFAHTATTPSRMPHPVTPKCVPRGTNFGWAMAAGLSALMVGGFVGHQLAESDQHSLFQQLGVPTPGDHQTMNKALSVSLESSASGTATPWRNPDTGHAGEVMPVRTFKNKNGQFCREFIDTSSVFGTDRESGGVACRGADGAWKVRVRYLPEV